MIEAMNKHCRLPADPDDAAAPEVSQRKYWIPSTDWNGPQRDCTGSTSLILTDLCKIG